MADTDEGWQEWKPLRPLRREMARRMAIAAQIPLAAQWIDVNLEVPLQRVEKLRAEGIPASLTSLALHAIGVALAEYPEMGAQFDFESGRSRLPERIRVSVAVATDRGLLVPVLDVTGMPVEEVATAFSSLVEEVRAGSVDSSAFEGGIFTITNIGSLGIEGGFPTPNPPQSAIMGMASMRTAPIVVDGALAVGRLTLCTLAIDHRAIDGVTSAKFFQKFVSTLTSG